MTRRRRLSLILPLLAAAPISAQDAPRFPLRAFALEAAPVDTEWADLDANGQPDCVQTLPGSRLGVTLGTGGGTFGPQQSVDLPGLDDLAGLALADFDGDGAVDVLVGNGAGEPTLQEQGVYLVRGDGAGGFSAPVQLVASEPVGFLDALDLDGNGFQDVLWAQDLRSQPAQAGAAYVLWGAGGGAFVRRSIPLPGVPSFLLVEDLDGDGLLDLAATTRTPDSAVVVRLATGPRTFGPARSYPTAQRSPDRLGSLDLDADGRAELVVSFEPVLVDLEVFDNDGAGAFSSAGLVGLRAVVGTRAFAVSDLDGDGDEDLVVSAGGADPGGSGAFVLHSTGGRLVLADSFALEPLDVEQLSVTSNLELLDVDGDGALELAYAADGPIPQVVIAEQDGLGSFEVPTTFVQLDLQADLRSATFADADGDGRADLLLADGTTAFEARVRWNDGSGAWTQETVLDGTVAALGPIRVADVDHDCLPDVLMLSVGSCALWRGTGVRSFGPQEQVPLTPFPGFLLELGDWDGDGSVDLAFGPLGVASSNFATVRNDGTGSFEAARVVLASVIPQTLASGDFDRDGRDELLVGSATLGGRPLALFDADAAGVFDAAGTTLWDGGVGIEDLQVTDVQGDGLLDVLALEPDRLVVLLGNGDGTFASTSVDLDAPAARVLARDVNGDGFVDACVVAGTSTVDGPATIYLADASGALVRSGGVFALGTLADVEAVELTDADQDGALELLAVSKDGDGRLSDAVPQAGDLYCQPDLGFGGPGSARLSACGDALTAGGRTTLRLTGARPNAPAFLVASTGFAPRPFFRGCSVLADAGLVLAGVTDATGAAQVAGVPGGFGPLAVYAQVAFVDPVLPGGVGLSNAVRLDFLR